MERHGDLAAHPVADLFPLLPEDELADLAEDIAAHGLIDPIVLDREGRVLDGRNRLIACGRAGIDPVFETYAGDDPEGFALACNGQRRMITKGQKAMVAARANFAVAKQRGPKGPLADRIGIPNEYLSMAFAVLEHAGDLADEVIAGGSLRDAYQVALQRKGRQQAAKDAEVRAAHAVEAAKEAHRQAQERATASTRAAEERIQLAVEEIGPEVPIPPEPDLSLAGSLEDPARPPDPMPVRGHDLRAQEEVLRRLIGCKRTLEAIAQDRPAVGGWAPLMQRGAVRSAVSQIVAAAYAIVGAYDEATDEVQTLRRVK